MKHISESPNGLEGIGRQFSNPPSQFESSMPMMVAIKELYDRGSFTDVELVGDGGSSEDAIACHKLVLSSCSMLFRQLLRDESDLVYLPDVSHSHLRTFVTGLYQQLAHAEPQWRALDPDLLTFLQIKEKLPPKRLKLVKRIRVIQAPESDQTEPPTKVVKLDAVNGMQESPTQVTQLDAVNVEPVEIETEDVISNGSGSSFECDPLAGNGEDSVDETKGVLADIVGALTSQDPRNIFDELPRRFRKPKTKPVPVLESQLEVIRVPDDERTSIMKKNSLAFGLGKKTCVSNIKEISSVVTSQNGTLTIAQTSTSLSYPAQAEEIKRLTRQPDIFIALLGIAETGPNQFEGRPLAWTKPGPADTIAEQFDDSVGAFRNIFGVTRAQLLSSKIVLTAQDGFRHSAPPSNRLATRRKLLTSTRQQVEEALQDSDIVYAFEKPSQITHQKLVLPLKDWDIQLSPSLQTFHELLVVRVANHAVDAQTVHVSPNHLDHYGKVLMKMLLLVWSGGIACSKIPLNKSINDKYQEVKTTVMKKDLAEKLLASGEDLPRKFPSFTCEICGITLRENVVGNVASKHRSEHLKERCGCDLNLLSLKERQNHFKKTHTKWQVACDDCSWVGTHKCLKKHRSDVHEIGICSECGKKLPITQLSEHIQCFHQAFKCDVCSVEVQGSRQFRKHCYNKHGDEGTRIVQRIVFPEEPLEANETSAFECERKEFPCDQCGKIFDVKLNLFGHIKYAHGKEEDKPFTCKLCGRKSFTKARMKNHLMCIHIKSFPFACRYSGCTKKFNGQASLRFHEVHAHERVHGSISDINLFVSDQELRNMTIVKPDVRLWSKTKE